VVTILRIRHDKLGSKLYVPPPADPDEMVMDAQTFKDLEIFAAEQEGASLFDLCNATRTDGGAKALRTRMKKPWSNPARIRAVQESLSFILQQRHLFDRLPSDVMTVSVENYLHGALPLVMSDNAFEFWIGALEVRFGDFRPYHRIVRGVQATSMLVQILRRLTAAPQLGSVPGELGERLAEIRTLLSRPALDMIPEQETWGQKAWTILRIDQMLRLREKETVDRLLHLAYEVDALVSMADATRQHAFVMPEIGEGSLGVEAEAVSHPFIQNAVANPLALDQGHRMLFLTGPNMAGKTTYLRACGIALYLAHLGMGVPARGFRFSPCQRLFSSITVADNVRSGVSFFRAEALRVKAIAQSVTDGYRVVALMDEPFKGTNVKDALDASRAILERFAAKEDCLFLVSSHLIELGDQMIATGQVDCRHFEAGEREGRLRFEYVLKPGVSTQRLGMRVLREEGIFDLLDAERGTPPVSAA
jgi:DNA mismatch repair protein MutS